MELNNVKMGTMNEVIRSQKQISYKIVKNLPQENNISQQYVIIAIDGKGLFIARKLEKGERRKDFTYSTTIDTQDSFLVVLEAYNKHIS